MLGPINIMLMNSSWAMRLPMTGSLNELGESTKFRDFPLPNEGGVGVNDGIGMGREIVRSSKVTGGIGELWAMWSYGMTFLFFVQEVVAIWPSLVNWKVVKRSSKDTSPRSISAHKNKKNIIIQTT